MLSIVSDNLVTLELDIELAVLHITQGHLLLSTSEVHWLCTWQMYSQAFYIVSCMGKPNIRQAASTYSLISLYSEGVSWLT